MSDRLRCIVPDCRRSAAQHIHPGADEIICGKHWRHVSARLRRLYSKVKRRYRRRGGILELRMCQRVWRWCKEAAIEGSSGLC